ncbi:MAG TPA: AraC family transcriptional regulator ligand-binding domain-containing protein [Mycobacterium sp.]|nr:AraC family transcriptional regulator ligand-binding domain-containing protein [Mycobacterium sp.]HKP42395.1 AraC family transcriptional regulator ligand-binding domain-containing protein [Mycobacterium sp.]
MAPTTWSPDLRHPIYATRLLCEVANERGVATSDILAGTGIAPGDLDDPEAVITASDEIVAVRRLLALLPDNVGLGIDVGSRYRLTHLGLFGFAAMSCATFRELFDVSMRYFSLTMLNIDVKLFEGAGSCVLEFDVDHLPADVSGFFLERDVASIVMTVSEFALSVVARYADQVTVEATLDKEVVAPLLALLPEVNREFGRAHNRLYFPRAMFDEPLPKADSHTLQTCIAQCDVLMQRNEQRRGITAVVRSKLFRESGRFPALPDVAAELDVHPRTLRRQLADEGTSFRALLNEARSTLAVDLLCNVGLTVEEVSKRLGYTDTSTFCHAFKRWHGVPPSAYPR